MTILILVSLVSPTLAVEMSCFPIGRARHDRECYDFESKGECLEKNDIYSCGWGERSENPPSDDDMLVCDDSRCKELIGEGDDTP